MSICRSCRQPLVNAPTRDWLELKCQTCGSAFCYSCGESPHFPAHCPENRRWLRRDIPNRRPYESFEPEKKRRCELMWAHLNRLRVRIEDVKRRYVEDGTYEFFELFYSHPHLRHEISEMCSVIELLRWFEVILSLNPLFEFLVRPKCKLVLDGLNKLVGSFPLPESPFQLCDLSSEREKLGEAVADILMELFNARRVTHLTPFPHTPAGAVAVGATALSQPSPITLPMMVEVPPGFVLVEEAAEGSDKTHMALIYLESVKWECYYHTRR